MGKHGPCYHCGVTSTPLWRNGPPEKPVLCNACGSRWRTKGTLANYTPLHARADPEEFDDPRFSKVKTIFIKNKEPKFLKRKLENDVSEFGLCLPENELDFCKGFNEDTSNRSSSGSAISNSESYVQYGRADASDLTGPSQPSAWDSMVPSRKRTCVGRSKPSPVEKLTKDLYTLWHEQQSSCISGSSEENLLLDSHKPMVSVEIGHGSVLIRHPNSIVREEESEASSLSVDNKQHNINSSSGRIEDTGINSLNIENETAVQERTISFRDKDQPVILPILALHNSPLCHIDLQEIVNLEVFTNYLTKVEQQQLMKLIPSVDTLDATFSLKSMFESAELKTNMLSFQKLLSEGVFGNSSRTFDAEESYILRELILCNFTKSKWVEQYTEFKDLKCKNSVEPEVMRGYNNDFESAESASFKRSRDETHQNITETKVMTKSPIRIIMKPSYFDEKRVMDKERGKSPLSMKNDNSSCFDGESYDQDLLLDLQPNGIFPQAELLPSTSFGGLVTTSSSSVYLNLLRH